MRTAARTGREVPTSASLTIVPVPTPRPAAALVGRARRIHLVRSARQPARPGGGRHPAATCRLWPEPFPACGGVMSFAPRHCHRPFQLHIPPGGIYRLRPNRPERRWPGRDHNWPGIGIAAADRRQCGSVLVQSSGRARATQTVRRWRPLSRRDFKMARPARVDIRLRKPCVFALLRVLGW
jgi:hypothetical protein